MLFFRSQGSPAHAQLSANQWGRRVLRLSPIEDWYTDREWKLFIINIISYAMRWLRTQSNMFPAGCFFVGLNQPLPNLRLHVGWAMRTVLTENIQLSILRRSRKPFTRTADGDIPGREEIITVPRHNSQNWKLWSSCRNRRDCGGRITRSHSV